MLTNGTAWDGVEMATAHIGATHPVLEHRACGRRRPRSNSGNLDDETLVSAMTGAPIPPQVPLVPGAGAVATSLTAFVNRFQPNFVATEYANVVSALCDTATPKTNVNVVRSTSFAQHPAALPGLDRGFATEDRAEVATTFPALASCYERIKAVVDRY